MAGRPAGHRRQRHRPQAGPEGVPADEFSAVAIAGAAGIAIEMIRLFQIELEHYEKIRAHRLSLEGKANYLARMVRNQLPMAFQGLAVVPLFGGYDEEQATGGLHLRRGRRPLRGAGLRQHRVGSKEAKAFLEGSTGPTSTRTRRCDSGGGAGRRRPGGHRHRGARPATRHLPNVVIVTSAGLPRGRDPDRVRAVAERALSTVR